MLRADKNATPSAVLEWEKSGKNLATALSAYLQSCTSLEILSAGRDVHQSGLPSLVKASLEILHPKLSDELSQSQVILARMHNKFSSRFHSLPNEILAEIFLDVVYDPGSNKKRFPDMMNDIKRNFWRLHCLMAVCSTWRNVIVQLGELWTIIPVTDNKLSCPTLEASSLALQRSHAWSPGKHQLHFAAVLWGVYYNPDTLLEGNGFPQFTTINIETRSKYANLAISSLLQKLLEPSPLISELFIHRYDDPQDSFLLRQLEQYVVIDFQMSDQERSSLKRLIESLVVLRLRNANIHWEKIVFSGHLVELHLQSVVFNEFIIDKFLPALLSAPNLRRLKLISVVSLPHGLEGIISKPKVELPQLHLLLLADLYFNILDYVLASIVPGSYQTKVTLTLKSWSTLRSQEDLDNGAAPDPGFDEGWDEVEVGDDDLPNLLKRSNIDTLILSPDINKSRWGDKENLRIILGSLPGLTSLIMTGWNWSTGLVHSLQPPAEEPFPRLTELYILDSVIEDAHLLPHIATSHSLQVLVVDSLDSLIPTDGDREDIIQRLRDTVPDLRFIGDSEQIDELNYESWRLW